MVQPFTDSLTTDVVLLSSFLSKEVRMGSLRVLNKRSAEYPMLNHISTLLNVGNTNSVPTVVGNIDAGRVQCTIFTERSTVINLDSAKGGPSNCVRQSVIPDPKRGAELLKNWEDDKYDCSFDIHLQDLFDIIGHLQCACHCQSEHLGNFISWTLRRAFRKLGWYFTEQWGYISPFANVDNHLNAELSKRSTIWTQCFDLTLPSLEHRMVKLFIEEDHTSQQGKHRFWFSHTNVKEWIALFRHLWEKLGGVFLETKPNVTVAAAGQNIISTTPDRVRIERLTVLIACLHALRPIMKYLISFLTSGALQLPAASENKEFQNFEWIADLDLPLKTQESLMIRGLQILLEMANWYTSPVLVGHHARKSFHDKTIQIQHFCWDEVGPFKCREEEAATILGVISSKRAHGHTIHDLQKAASSATVHAASAWTLCVHYKPWLFAGVPQLPISTSRNCCALCWLLEEDLSCNSSPPELSSLVAFSDFLPWVPPFGVPERTLWKLREKLLQVIYRLAGA